MKLTLGAKLGTSLAITPQLQQAIRLLQLSTLELEQEIQQQIDTNPLLERIEDSSAEPDATFSQTVEAVDASAIGVDQHLTQTALGNDLPVDTQWDDVFSQQGTALGTPEFEEREDNSTAHESLHDALMWQLNLTRLNPPDQLIALCIIDAIDERGYLEACADEILEAANQQFLSAFPDAEPLEIDEFAMVLKHVQHFEPPGVGARDLAECLCLQLHALPPDTPFVKQALALLDCIDLIIAQDLNRLARSTQLSEADVLAAMRLIQTLNPHPGLIYQDTAGDHQVPDVIVTKRNNRWEVQLNTDILPKVRINQYYAGMVKRADNSRDNQYIRDHLQDARNFIKGVEERHKTLLKVATCIVQHQRAFLEHGPEAMRPLILKDIADEVELHESTVSRVTTQKFMLTQRGLFELKYFFSSHVGTSTGGECSSTAIRAMIRKMIQEEDPRKPLSDNVLMERLQAGGIDVARRTVAKYRESLNIGSSSERKRRL